MTIDFERALAINPGVVEQVLTSFIRNELNRHGFERAVLGVSGGIDSAVACALSSRALGAQNVLAVRMPHRDSSEDSLAHAQQLIDQLGVQHMTLPITEMVDGYLEQLDEIDKNRRGNVMARARMIVLYDQSAATKALVIGTGNKTEILLGYTTLYGDSASAINPNGDLYKTQLRQLAEHLQIPQVIMDKPPSADLWPGQTDEGELGFTYERVDQLLYLLVDERYAPEECRREGFQSEFIDEVIARIRQSQYKRVMPPIAKISNRTIGHDFLYPRDWGT